MSDERDTHSGCEMCGVVQSTEYTEGRGYLCPECLAGDDDYPNLEQAFAAVGRALDNNQHKEQQQ